MAGESNVAEHPSALTAHRLASSRGTQQRWRSIRDRVGVRLFLVERVSLIVPCLREILRGLAVLPLR